MAISFHNFVIFGNYPLSHLITLIPLTNISCRSLITDLTHLTTIQMVLTVIFQKIIYHSGQYNISSTLGPDVIYGGSAQEGYCPDGCTSLYVYISMTIISKMVSASGRVGETLIFLR